jgi:exodeoxyribonuclease VII small subunit
MARTKKQAAPATAEKDFATQLGELEKVVGELENDIAIEKALALFERGMQLSNECEKVLSAAEQKVEILKRSASGGTVVETFNETAVSFAGTGIDDEEDNE